MKRIPLVDLRAEYRSIKEEIDEAIATVLDESAFIGGPHVAAFERDFAAYCRADYAVGVSNGTDALMLALKGLGIGAGDEVITVPNTFIATSEAIAMVGAQVRFVDVEPRTLTMDPERLERALSPRTRAVIPVHLYGQAADMDPILALADQRGIAVIEDAAQAHGAEYRRRRVGTLGRMACFSFYPGKNLGAYGDAGALVTNDKGLAERIAMLRNHGRARKYDHSFEGFNCRLDGLQAAILRVKLKHLERWTEKRIELAGRYRELLDGTPGLTLPAVREGSRAVFHLFVVRTEKRDGVLELLKDQGIECGVHYPICLHRLAAYEHLKLGAGSFPVAEAAATQILSLPLYPEMSDDDLVTVAEAVRSATRV